jgi:hypothetical protein
MYRDDKTIAAVSAGLQYLAQNHLQKLNVKEPVHGCKEQFVRNSFYSNIYVEDQMSLE